MSGARRVRGGVTGLLGRETVEVLVRLSDGDGGPDLADLADLGGDAVDGSAAGGARATARRAVEVEVVGDLTDPAAAGRPAVRGGVGTGSAPAGAAPAGEQVDAAVMALLSEVDAVEQRDAQRSWRRGGGPRETAEPPPAPGSRPASVERLLALARPPAAPASAAEPAPAPPSRPAPAPAPPSFVILQQGTSSEPDDVPLSPVTTTSGGERATRDDPGRRSRSVAEPVVLDADPEPAVPEPDAADPVVLDADDPQPSPAQPDAAEPAPPVPGPASPLSVILQQGTSSVGDDVPPRPVIAGPGGQRTPGDVTGSRSRSGGEPVAPDAGACQPTTEEPAAEEPAPAAQAAEPVARPRPAGTPGAWSRLRPDQRAALDAAVRTGALVLDARGRLAALGLPAAVLADVPADPAPADLVRERLASAFARHLPAPAVPGVTADLWVSGSGPAGACALVAAAGRGTAPAVLVLDGEELPATPETLADGVLRALQP